MKFICEVCGYVYDEDIGDPENDILEGTKFSELPEDWACPMCFVGKEDFSEAD